MDYIQKIIDLYLNSVNEVDIELSTSSTDRIYLNNIQEVKLELKDESSRNPLPDINPYN